MILTMTDAYNENTLLEQLDKSGSQTNLHFTRKLELSAIAWLKEFGSLPSESFSND